MTPRWLVGSLAAVLALGATNAFSQDGYSAAAESRAEIIPHFGYAWTFSRDFYYGVIPGTADIEDGGYWGVAVDLAVRPARPARKARLLYRRQSADLTFESITTGTVKSDLVTEYWHVGGVGGYPRGNVVPYGHFTLGATRYSSSNFDDVWKFSMIFGFGAKIYSNQRLGAMLQWSLPLTVFSGDTSIGCGTGGCYTSVGGFGITQMDLTAGITFKL
jgi:hypothetical protein